MYAGPVIVRILAAKSHFKSDKPMCSSMEIRFADDEDDNLCPEVLEVLPNTLLLVENLHRLKYPQNPVNCGIPAGWNSSNNSTRTLEMHCPGIPEISPPLASTEEVRKIRMGFCGLVRML